MYIFLFKVFQLFVRDLRNQTLDVNTFLKKGFLKALYITKETPKRNNFYQKLKSQRVVKFCFIP